MEQRDESFMNNSRNKPPSSQHPLETPSSATKDEPGTVNRQGLPDSETINVNHSGNPSLRPETQSSSPSNHQNLYPSSPSPSQPPKIPGGYDVSHPKSTSGPRSSSSSSSSSSSDDFSIRLISDPGPAIQNPPVQVMERAEEPGTPSGCRIPSHVFDRAKSGTPEWSVASNESLFSIHMGNMSFSKELNWLNSEMNTSSDPLPPLSSDNINGGNTKNNKNNQSEDNKPNDPSTSNQSPANNSNHARKADQNQANKPNDISTVDPSQANKFNNMSHSVGKSHQDHDEMTEAKAAETMRQVMMENSDAYDSLSVSAASHNADGSNHNNNINVNNDISRHSDCSTKSFAFNLRPEEGKSQRSPKGFPPERPKQNMQTESEAGTQKESSKATSNQATKPSSNAPFYKYLCCFTCCIK